MESGLVDQMGLDLYDTTDYYYYDYTDGATRNDTPSSTALDFMKELIKLGNFFTQTWQHVSIKYTRIHPPYSLL